MSATPAHDVIVVGAGPAGSTAAALLARAGRSVLVLEKHEFPRFHIGESLLPGGAAILERLGVRPEGDVFLRKAGARFVCETTGRSATFAFADALDGCPPFAWHVERAKFDTLLRDAAREAGADVRHGETVRGVVAHAERVDVRTEHALHPARFLIDATGQDRLLATLHGSATPYDEFGHAAVFTHFTHLPQAALDDLGDDNDIRVLLRDDGWGWMIPLTGARLSIGLVCRGRATPALLDEGLLQSRLARRWTAGAVRGETRIVSDYSVRNGVPRGPRWASIGDAACFIDPVFSSGVMLAMRAAEDLADRLAPALERGDEADTDFSSPACERAVATFHALVDRFYNTTFARTLLLGDSTGYETRRGVLSVLAGDVWRDDNPFQDMLLAGRRRAHAPS
ncbi:MAG: tryptophan 7-halogenase [Planctomycetes bacterium]|nr:tryptophan 7-halogenase [Planctomycetota bacterium]